MIYNRLHKTQAPLKELRAFLTLVGLVLTTS